MQILYEKLLLGADETPVGNCIEIKGVTFAYEKANVLKDISFPISPKSITALVGPSGSGKSTVAYLITRF